MPDAIGDRKRELRRELRAQRLEIDDVADRSRLIWTNVRTLPAVRSARTIMVFESIPGEPDTAPFVAWCGELNKHLVMPGNTPGAAMPDEPGSIDVVIVPGVAFTEAGDRLGQGGGWYDRLLAEVRDDCVAIGVAFDEQLVDELPTDEHARQVDVVVTA